MLNEKLKILLLTTHLDTGGIAVYVTGLADALKRHGVDATVASGGGRFEQVLAERGVPHIKLDIRTKFEFGAKMWKAVPSLTRLVKENGFNLIHSQTRVAQVLGAIVCKITDIPLVTTCHGFYEYQRLSRRFFPCWGDLVIAISKSVSDHLIEDFHVSPEQVIQVYNGIELDRYIPENNIKDELLMERIGLKKGQIVIGAVSRLVAIKGIKYLIHAFSKVYSKYPDTRLLLIGNGPERQNLEKEINELGISHKVFMISEEKTPLEKYMFIFDIFCLPSLKEGLGMSLMEAMAAGRACIASDIAGPAELIENGVNGILLPPADEGALAGAILRLVQDKALRATLANNARQKAFDNFSIDKSSERMIEAYKEIKNRK